MSRISFNDADAISIGDEIDVDWSEIEVEEFRMGLNVELEHGTVWEGTTNVTNDDELLTGKIAYAHLLEFPDYYTRLKKMEEEGDRFWKGRSRKIKDRQETGTNRDFKVSKKSHFDRMKQ